ncbi:YaiO family outer membrane beta-barrel protein [Sphaerotilus montanus]|jgi:YaiO family outer membrane protein|uniref:YaiO family outer membrane protein n=1 Tax=Sphaerotilus montanus TaxID=522889 RepID=A0A7Y9U500_9BURK|nr:YaiO family outer membrane beta-barrel protein [Sphaerotilus montanus]NYG31077.1 YaiO family outer membrane protein [Sphaerotilus montanus]NZD59167.1 YaiO family outer membrane beta-barrel protein [Sphaerotilus montanus]
MRAATLTLLLAPLLCSAAQADEAPPVRRGQIEVGRQDSRHSAGLPGGRATHLRGNWALGQDTVLNAELLSERKFDASGGVAAVGATRNLDQDWFASATLSRGWGGPNWARHRIDASVSRKWGASRQFVTTLGGYRANFDAGRSDRGLRVSANYYLNHFVVFEGGATFNTSHPGQVRSQMPYLAVTLGTPGLQFLSLRASRGSEAYQSVGTGAQLVDFDSQSLSLDWRYWLAPDWGMTVHAERYLNPSYSRTTVGGGLFLQL